MSGRFRFLRSQHSERSCFPYNLHCLRPAFIGLDVLNGRRTVFNLDSSRRLNDDEFSSDSSVSDRNWDSERLFHVNSAVDFSLVFFDAIERDSCMDGSRCLLVLVVRDGLFEVDGLTDVKVSSGSSWLSGRSFHVYCRLMINEIVVSILWYREGLSVVI